MTKPMTIRALMRAIEALPSDPPKRIPGKRYTTQREHWLGWLREYHGPGAYGRAADRPRRDARFAYNHVVESKMLSWLIEAAGIDPKAVAAARRAAGRAEAMMRKAAAIRRVVPWESVQEALLVTRRVVPERDTYEFVCRHPHGTSAISGYRRAARKFGLSTLEDPTTSGTDSTRLLVHKDARKLERAARRLSRAYDSGDDDAIEEGESWLAYESDVHWFDHDWRFWDIEQDEGALENLGWSRTITTVGNDYRVRLQRVVQRRSK